MSNEKKDEIKTEDKPKENNKVESKSEKQNNKTEDKHLEEEKPKKKGSNFWLLFVITLLVILTFGFILSDSQIRNWILEKILRLKKKENGSQE